MTVPVVATGTRFWISRGRLPGAETEGTWDSPIQSPVFETVDEATAHGRKQWPYSDFYVIREFGPEDIRTQIRARLLEVIAGATGCEYGVTWLQTSDNEQAQAFPPDPELWESGMKFRPNHPTLAPITAQVLADVESMFWATLRLHGPCVLDEDLGRSWGQVVRHVKPNPYPAQARLRVLQEESELTICHVIIDSEGHRGSERLVRSLQEWEGQKVDKTWAEVGFWSENEDGGLSVEWKEWPVSDVIKLLGHRNKQMRPATHPGDEW